MLPPLSGYTDYPYRQILAKFEPPFITTEMVNARAVVEGNQRTVQMLKKVIGSHFNGAQLLGKDPNFMAKAAKIIENMGFDYVDINMGCTVTVSNAVDIPVTVKLRTGFCQQSINVISLSQKLACSGAAAITIHGRTGEKKFGNPLNIHQMREVASTLSIPVIANGGVFSGIDAQNMLLQTGAVAVMPGRGILGNPWIIPEILCNFSGDIFTFPTLQEKKDICAEHIHNVCEFYGEKFGVLKMRRIVFLYFSSCRYLKSLKNDIHMAETIDDIHVLLHKIKEVDGVWIYE
jgi:tRNA-dihydrouridine synthase B